MYMAYMIRHTRKIIRQMPKYWLPFKALLHIYEVALYMYAGEDFVGVFFLDFYF